VPVQVRPAVPEAASGDNRPFWAIFLCKENSPQRRYRGLIAFQASCLLCGLYIPSPFPPLVFAFIRNMRLAKPPANAPMGAAEDMSAASRNAISIPSSAPIAAEAAMTVANITTMMNAIPIFRMIKSLPKRDASLVTKGYSRP
jgi:hypothetical protein